jgi:hypothetical protein
MATSFQAELLANDIKNIKKVLEPLITEDGHTRKDVSGDPQFSAVVHINDALKKFRGGLEGTFNSILLLFTSFSSC